MNIIIIEDEYRAAKSLQNTLLKLDSQIKILGIFDSIEMTVETLSKKMDPDLIFMDIHLSDGLSFEIFKHVKINCPIIFCTAFDQYMLDAFRNKGVDYILKPYTEEEIVLSLKKVTALKTFFQRNDLSKLEYLLKDIQIEKSNIKSSFLVFKNQKYTTIQVENIAFFFIKNEITHLVTFDNQQYTINYTIGQIEDQISSKQFYRLNRQYLINFTAIAEMEHHFQRKILIRLKIETPDELLLIKEKKHSFFTWLEER